jgi:hypothetical protein
MILRQQVFRAIFEKLILQWVPVVIFPFPMHNSSNVYTPCIRPLYLQTRLSVFFRAVKAGRKRAEKPPFYKNVFVRHRVNPAWHLELKKIAARRQLEPCVVMGRGHSGTRVVAWICYHIGVEMGTDAARFASGDPAENSFKHHQRVVATRSLDVCSPEQLRASDLNRFQKAVYGFHRRLAVNDGLWGWKFPETYLISPYVEKTFPRARYIHLIRDGRDVAFKRHLTDVPEHRLARAILRRQDALGLAHHLQAALSWALQVELFELFRKSVPDERILELRYETLVSDPLSAAQQICRFLGVPLTSAAREYVERGISAAQVGAFRSEDSMKVREIEDRIGDTLRRHGYMEAAGSP